MKDEGSLDRRLEHEEDVTRITLGAVSPRRSACRVGPTVVINTNAEVTAMVDAYELEIQQAKLYGLTALAVTVLLALSLFLTR